jgi:hypothetical protein
MCNDARVNLHKNICCNEESVFEHCRTVKILNNLHNNKILV